MASDHSSTPPPSTPNGSHAENTLCLHDICVSSDPASDRLCNINGAFYAGEIVALIGPNGAGKSSLLAVAGLQLAPTHGKLTLFGKNPREWLPQRRAQRVALLTQHHELNFSFTVEEVIRLGRLCHAEPAQTTQHIIEDYLIAFDLIPLRHRDYTTLSGGEQQRVHLARVFSQISALDLTCYQPRLLLLDEPTTALDLAHQALLIRALQHAAQQGVTILIAIHDLSLAGRIGHRIVCLERGQLRAAGAPQDVLTKAIIESVFRTPVTINHRAGSQPMIFLDPVD